MKELCLQLIKSDSEREVINLLKKNNYWDDDSQWKFYGNNENNFSSIGNQQSKPDAALVEKLVNSVDAILTGECLVKGIHPESPQAPQSIDDAVEQFFDLYEGSLLNTTNKQRRKLAERIGLIATGSKSTPSYAIYDTGEGQCPENFEHTFLSLSKSNKLRTPFVQGRFNMGSTGVLQFCGHHNIQLIVSKRNQGIADAKEKWGFTIIRRVDPSGGVRSSAYKYLAPGGIIPSFKAESLDILPGNYPNAHATSLHYGTYIKLYEYQIGSSLRTNILFDLYNRISLLMPKTALPVRFFERRRGYSGHTMEATMAGLNVRVEEDKKDNIEDGFPSSSTLQVNGQKIAAKIYAFKKNGAEKYVDSQGIIFTSNGQTQGQIDKRFFHRNKVGMSYLAGSILVMLDCSAIQGRTREDLFMNSRDRLREGEVKSEIEKILEELISSHQGLRNLREKRRREALEERLGDSKPLAEVIEKIMKKSPTLSKLFLQGLKLSNPFKTEGAKPDVEFHGKHFPSHFRLIKKFPEDHPKECHLGAKFRVQYDTDVRNDYFDEDRKDKDRGSCRIFVNDEEVSEFSMNLWNGTASLNLFLPGDVQIGDVVKWRSEITDSTQLEPFVEEFHIQIKPKQKHVEGSGNGNRRPPHSDENGKLPAKEDGFALPNIIEVHKSQWDDYGFDQNIALAIKNFDEDTYDFFINVDNIHLLTEQKAKREDGEAKVLKDQYTYGMVLIGLALIQQSFKVDEDDTPIEDRVKSVTTAISPMLLPMISSLGGLSADISIDD